MSRFWFTSRLPRSYRAELGSLMFFNPQQHHVKLGIVESIERYGIPKIVENGDHLNIRTDKFIEVQALFALEGKPDDANLIGVLVYVRINSESMVVLHIGVKEEYSVFGIHSNEMLTMKLLVRLREIARQIKGVRSIAVIYGKGIIRKIPV